ncbi:hypothetical protein ABK040_009403 [Willaertia magna]
MSLRKDNLIFFIIGIAFFIRILIAMYQPHSGYNKGPMHGDLEAQRHWIEITSNLNIKEWYFYDLEYWGLDYPPLTAFHHYLMGKINEIFNICEDCFTFEKSRGNQQLETILFMRYSVLIADLLIFIPSILLLLNLINNFIKLTFLDYLFVLTCPSFILIDHGHFQFNNICLGLSTLSIYFLFKFKNIYLILSCICFVFSICYKQMALYYSLTFFFFILAIIINNFKRFLFVGITVVSSFVIQFLPFYLFSGGDLNIVKQVIHRMFPFKRGLFEDKVASFWCSTNVIIKWNNLFDINTLIKLSTCFTLLMALPSCIHLFIKVFKNDNNNKLYLLQLFLLNMIICSFSFYLFSFQVHEKTILFCLFPCLFFFLTNNNQSFLSELVPLLSTISLFSMYPLFIKDNLEMVYFLSQLACLYFILIPIYRERKVTAVTNVITGISIVGMIIIHICISFITPPPRYSDLFILFCTTFSFLHFSAFVLLSYWTQFTIAPQQ